MSKLPRRNMGRTGMQPRALGMGAAFVGASGEAETIATIERALDLGIDYFDSYAGRNEGPLGQGANRRRAVELLHAGQSRPAPGAPQGLFRRSHALERRTESAIDSRGLPRRRAGSRPARYCRSVRPRSRLRRAAENEGRGLGAAHWFGVSAITTSTALPSRLATPRLSSHFLDYTLLDQSVARTTMRLAKKHGNGPDLGQRLWHGSLDGH